VQLGAEAVEAAEAAVEAGGPAQAAEAVGCGRPVGGLWSANGITPREFGVGLRRLPE